MSSEQNTDSEDPLPRSLHLTLSDNTQAMVYTVTKRTPKRRAGAVLKRAAKRARKPGADFSDLVGTAPLHKDPVKFQRALRDEE